MPTAENTTGDDHEAEAALEPEPDHRHYDRFCEITPMGQRFMSDFDGTEGGPSTTTDAACGEQERVDRAIGRAAGALLRAASPPHTRVGFGEACRARGWSRVAFQVGEACSYRIARRRRLARLGYLLRETSYFLRGEMQGNRRSPLALALRAGLQLLRRSTRRRKM